MVTGYDYPMALIQERVDIDIILVGDSLAMTVLGYNSTLPVTMDTMLDHAKAVRRGAPNAYVIGDMPYMSYQISIEQAINNAGRFMKEAGCDAVKLEGGSNVTDVVEAFTKSTIPVMAHIGLTPQSIAMLGGFKSQGRSLEAAEKLITDAKALEEAGAVALLVEAVPPEVGLIITERATIPVIGIGAGPHCHGQLLIAHDMLGWFESFTPKFVRKYADIGTVMYEAFTHYITDIKEGNFPAQEHYYKMQPGAGEELLKKYIG